MQPNTQQPSGQNQGFYTPSQPSPYQPPVNDEFLAPEAPHIDPSATVTWEASEYIHRAKDAAWIAGFVTVVALALGVSIFLQAWTFAVLVVVMSLALGVFAFRKPHVKHYTLTHDSLTIDEKTFELTDFRAFGILAEDAFFSVMLIPVKRFMPAVTVYFAQEDGEQIVDILSTTLPLEDLQPDPIDALMRRLHF